MSLMECELPAESSNKRPPHRFKAGNKHGKGNPYAKLQQKLRAGLAERVSISKLQKIMAAMEREAIAGDVAAAEFIFRRLFGKDGTIFGEDISGQAKVQIIQLLTSPELVSDANNLLRHIIDGTELQSMESQGVKAVSSTVMHTEAPPDRTDGVETPVSEPKEAPRQQDQPQAEGGGIVPPPDRT